VALAMAGQNEVLQAQRTLRNNRFAVATPALPATPAATTTEAIPTVKAEPETTAAMQKLLDELQAMKAINQYQNAAQNMPLAGENVNVVN
jgi:7-keto-8-aminopelargonate synthetase-like enzyme